MHAPPPAPPSPPGSSFGKVFKALNVTKAQIVALKIVPVESDSGEVSREIAKHVSVSS